MGLKKRRAYPIITKENVDSAVGGFLAKGGQIDHLPPQDEVFRTCITRPKEGSFDVKVDETAYVFFLDGKRGEVSW